MNKPIYIVDDVRDIVLATQNAVDKPTGKTLLEQLQMVDEYITGVHYQHGHPKEILEILMTLSGAASTKFNKFPLIALFQDFPETIGAPGFYADVNLHIIIAMSTEQNYKADDRYEKNFKPILYPVYFQFLEQIRLSRKFEIITGDQYPHVKIDRVFWGREGLYGSEGNKFNDKIDCIEIKDLKLRRKTQNC